MALRLWTHEEVLASQPLPRPSRLVPGVLLSPQAVTVARTPTALPVPTQAHACRHSLPSHARGDGVRVRVPWPPRSAHSPRRRRGAQDPGRCAGRDGPSSAPCPRWCDQGLRLAVVMQKCSRAWPAWRVRACEACAVPGEPCGRLDLEGAQRRPPVAQTAQPQ